VTHIICIYPLVLAVGIALGPTRELLSTIGLITEMGRILKKNYENK